MDSTDVKILNILLEKPKVKYKDIAKELKTTIGTVHNRIKAMEEKGTVRGMIPEIETSKIGYDVVAVILLTITGGHVEQVEKKYASHKNVCSVYDITGASDSLMIVKFKSTADLNKFVKKLMAEEFVERTNTSIVLNTVKEALSPFPLE